MSVLASPFVGVSNDALFLLRRAAGKRPLFSGMERELPGRGRRRVTGASSRRSASATTGWCGPRATSGLERLCERIVSEHDYDLAVLAQWDGRRRYANLRKLARLARSYEELRGPDIEGLPPLRRRPGGRRRARGRGRRGGGGRRRGAAPDHSLGEGPRVQGRRRRGRGPEPPSTPCATRSCACRTGGSASGSSTPRPGSATPLRASTSCGQRTAPPTRPRRAASTTWR